MADSAQNLADSEPNRVNVVLEGVGDWSPVGQLRAVELLEHRGAVIKGSCESSRPLVGLAAEPKVC